MEVNDLKQYPKSFMTSHCTQLPLQRIFADTEQKQNLHCPFKSDSIRFTHLM